MTEEDKKILLEKLSILEHEQWMIWAKHVLETEHISDRTKERWQKDFVAFADLTEPLRDKDRVFAKKSLEVFEEYLNTKNR